MPSSKGSVTAFLTCLETSTDIPHGQEDYYGISLPHLVLHGQGQDRLVMRFSGKCCIMPLLKILYVNSPKYDLITALHIEGLQSIDNVELRCTTLGNYARPEQVLYKWDAIDYGNQEADVIILGSRPYVESDVFWSIKRKGMICVRMEGGDESALGVRLRDLFKYDFIFKRELYLRSGSLKHLWSSLYPRHTGLWRELRAHPLVPFPFFHSMGNHNTWLHVGHNFLMQQIKNRVHPFPMGLERRFQGEFNSNPEFELSCMITPHLDDRTELIELLN